MALTQKDRSAKTAARRKTRGEEEIRLHCMAGTRQALAELMAWSGNEEQGEAITLMIHHLHQLGPRGALPLLTPPRHKYEVSHSVALEFSRRSMLMIQQDPGDEIVAPDRNLEGAGGFEPPAELSGSCVTRPALRNLNIDRSQRRPAPSKCRCHNHQHCS